MTKKILVIFGIMGIAGAAWALRDRILAGALGLGGKVSQFIDDRTPELEEEESENPRTIRFPKVEEEE